MMLQLVQSPSQRVQRLIKAKCSNDDDGGEPNGERADTAVSSTRTRPQVDQGAERDNDEAGDSFSSVAGSSNLTSRRQKRPFVTQVDELLDRDGNVIAASVMSYSSDGNNSANKNELDDDAGGSPGHGDDREPRHH